MNQIMYKLRRYFSNRVKSLVAVFLVSGNARLTLLKSRKVIENSNLTRTLSLQNVENIDRQLQIINDAYELDHNGRYIEAAALRGNLLKNIYDHADTGEGYFPPLFGGRWTNYIGHLAVLSLHSKAQELGIVPSGKRVLLTTGSVANQKLCDLLGESYSQLSDPYLANLEFFPPTQVLFENYHSIRTNNGFMETHGFIEKVFSENIRKNFNAPIIHLDNVERNVDRELKEKFLSKAGSRFVAIHMRNTGNGERRDVIPATYFKAFSFLIRKGFSIVNIGPEVQSNYDVEIINVRDRDLHPYIMMKAEMAITTTSGPSLLPSLFGTPNLVTNVTSVGRNMINCNNETLYLPKHFYENGKKLKFREILDLEIAYDEREKSELEANRITFQGNSSEEISSAVKWLVTAIESTDFKSHDVDSKVRTIQQNQSAISFGRLIPSYLETNPEYLE